MAVEITSPVLGKEVGESYAGPLEAFLLAEGYAKQESYTGVGVSNTGPTDVDPDDDPTVAANREEPYWPLSDDNNVTMANDAENLNKKKFPAPGFDFNAGGDGEGEEEPEPGDGEGDDEPVDP